MRIFKGDWMRTTNSGLSVLSVVARPWTALIIAAAACWQFVSVVSALLWLNVSSDQDKLFSTKLKAFSDYAEFDRQFPENDAVYIVIEEKTAKSGPRPASVDAGRRRRMPIAAECE